MPCPIKSCCCEGWLAWWRDAETRLRVLEASHVAMDRRLLASEHTADQVVRVQDQTNELSAFTTRQVNRLDSRIGVVIHHVGCSTTEWDAPASGISVP